MKDLGERLDRIRREIDVLRGQEALLMDLMGRSEPPVKERAPRANVKQAVIDLLRDAKANGLNAAMAVATAKERHGIDLDRGSVSSLLSRMKHEGLVTYINNLYRLTEYSEGIAEATKPSASVHPLRASGDTP